MIATLPTLLLNLVFALFLFVLPGYGLLTLLARRGEIQHIPERIGLALALSFAIYPLLYLWSWWLGLTGGLWVVWGPGVLGAAATGWHLWRTRSTSLSLNRGHAGILPMLALLAVVAAIAYTRVVMIRDLVAPAWGDSVHHALIVQLMLEHGGLFQSWRPYAPLETFTYHMGLHANVTVWAAALRIPADRALLEAGQLFNVFAVLALYPLAYRLGGRNAWAGIATVGVAGLISTMPGYYTNWGRYTQLGAQIILPALLWSFDCLWHNSAVEDADDATQDAASSSLPGPGRLSSGILLTLLAAGLVLTHYRVAMVAGAGGLAWAAWGLWTGRSQLDEWLRGTLTAGGAAVSAGLLAAPWVLRLGQGHLTTVASSISAPADSDTAASELVMWSVALDYYPLWLILLSVLALGVAFWRIPRLGAPLFLWGTLAFLAANPAVLGLRGSGLISNFLLLIGVYVLFAVPLGWLLAWTGRHWLSAAKRLTGPRAGPRTGQSLYRGAQLLLGAAVLVAAIWGIRVQSALMNPFHAMVFAPDKALMAWIAEETPPDAHFLANSFLAFSDLAVVGSDAGWWIPYYTGRSVNVLPITYTMEAVGPEVDKQAMLDLVVAVQQSGGDPAALRAPLCRHAITHLYQGQRSALYAPPSELLLPTAWFASNSDFTLLHQIEDAAVWSFDRTVCTPAE